MKKLLTLLMLLITSTFNNLSFTEVDDMPFTTEYYNGSVHDKTDYRKLYNKFIQNSDYMNDHCDTTPVLGEDFDKNKRSMSNNSRCWFILEQELSPSEYFKDNTKTKMFKKEAGLTIIAPDKCTIMSSASTSQRGTRMTLLCGDYTIELTDMGRWYCCANREPSVKDDPTHLFSHTADAKGTELLMGQVIGYTSAATKVTIKKDNKAVALSDFYQFEES